MPTDKILADSEATVVSHTCDTELLHCFARLRTLSYLSLLLLSPLQMLYFSQYMTYASSMA